MVFQGGQVLNDWYGWCYAVAWTAFKGRVTNPTAWAAWLATAYPHKDRNLPSGVYVPIWFSGYGGAGHVALYKDGQIWTSPYTHKAYFDRFNSIDALARYYGVTYVGWSEDIGGVRVVQPSNQGDIMNQDSGTELYRTGLHRDPESAGAASQWNGQSATQALASLRNSAEWKSTDAKLKAYDSLAAQVADLSSRPTKDQLQAVVDQFNSEQTKVADLQKALETEKANIKVQTIYTEDTQTRDNVSKILDLVTKLTNYFADRYKGARDYFKK